MKIEYALEKYLFTLGEMQKLRLIFWRENFVGMDSFCRVSGNSSGTLRKLCVST